MRSVTLWFSVALVGAAFAGAPQFAAQTVPGTTHEEGEAKWTDSLLRTPSDSCADASIRGSMATGRPSSQKPRDDAADCVRNVVSVRNESVRPVQCTMRLDLEAPDERGVVQSEGEMVIFPGMQEAGADSHGRASPAPKGFSSTCVIVPASLSPEEPIPEGCQTEVSGPFLADYYPPGAKRRNEQGRVVLEYSLVEGSTKPANVRLVGSSGYQDLDNAALKYSKGLRMKQACTDNRRHRLNVAFQLRES
jgi:TonB family protein